jgi:8-oxo-dGTP diphosphatase
LTSPDYGQVEPLHVVAAAVIDAEGRILIAQRPAGKRQAGFWEFPGGKLEPGETRVQGLSRELKEELGIDLTGYPRPLMRLRHAYPFGDVLIDMWVVTRYSGEPQGLDRQALKWCSYPALSAADLLPADGPLVAALGLPAILTSTAMQVGNLRGAVIATMRDGLEAAEHRAADYFLLPESWPDETVASICHDIFLPVYCRCTNLERAWSLGATGIITG